MDTNTQQRIGPWYLVKTMNQNRETRVSVVRNIGSGRREWMIGSNGRPTQFKTRDAAHQAIKSATTGGKQS